LEHSDRDQVVVDVASNLRARKQLDRTENSHEVVLAQSINKVVDYQFQATKATHDCLFIFEFESLADCCDDNPPSFVSDLLPALLDDLFKSLDYSTFVLAVIGFQLVGKRLQNRRLPREITPGLLIC
jgi:hypothetical protein